ncbi:uncharacterized protein DUF2867 [Propionicimonas paludicola]|uniref:Uncharacterized protein DUF2867 n=1 Tax=Propionicimonas paludicola TaxID=185243 RepID=A0A2A9CWB2_9ACTN|nr:DUF2867 domain-containing protein [Propionicimonas paludicola]PFG18426.1 uncharacterized protein DUF2867 [Propionicimonas paludicola]
MTRATCIPAGAQALARTPGFDYADAQLIELPTDTNRDPAVWAERIFSHESWPMALRALMVIRNAIVPLFGIRRETGQGTLVSEVIDGEALIENRDKHLDFRIGTTISDDVLCIVTVVKLHGWLGRLYFLPVRVLHPVVAETMLRRVVRDSTKPGSVLGQGAGRAARLA